MEGVHNEVGDGRQRGGGHGLREGRRAGTCKQMHDKLRAEFCGVFMAVVQILFGSEKGNRGGDGGVILTTMGYVLVPATGGSDLDHLLKGLGWRAVETAEGSETVERQQSPQASERV